MGIELTRHLRMSHCAICQWVHVKHGKSFCYTALCDHNRKKKKYTNCLKYTAWNPEWKVNNTVAGLELLDTLQSLYIKLYLYIYIHKNPVAQKEKSKFCVLSLPRKNRMKVLQCEIIPHTGPHHIPVHVLKLHPAVTLDVIPSSSSSAGALLLFVCLFFLTYLWLAIKFISIFQKKKKGKTSMVWTFI